MFKVEDIVKIKDTKLMAQDELLSEETLNVLKAVDFTGTITQVQDNLYYVGFIDKNDNWVTQVFKENEIEGVDA